MTQLVEKNDEIIDHILNRTYQDFTTSDSSIDPDTRWGIPGMARALCALGCEGLKQARRDDDREREYALEPYILNDGVVAFADYLREHLDDVDEAALARMVYTDEAICRSVTNVYKIMGLRYLFEKTCNTLVQKFATKTDVREGFDDAVFAQLMKPLMRSID